MTAKKDRRRVSKPRVADQPRELTAKEFRFVEEFLVDLNATHAAIRAGYSEKTAKEIGYELLRKPDVQAAITAAMSARSQRTRVTQDRVLTAISDMAYFDIADAFTEDGALREVHELSPALRSAIAGIEIEEIRLGKDGPVVGRIKKVKLADRKGSLELLGRHLKLFTDRVEHSGNVTIEDFVSASRTNGVQRIPGYGPVASNGNGKR